MFEVHYTKRKGCYLLTHNDDKFYARVTPTKGYPRTAKRPYKGQVSMIKNDKFIPLDLSHSSSRQLYSAIMDRLTQFIQREESIKKLHDEETTNLEAKCLDDID